MQFKGLHIQMKSYLALALLYLMPAIAVPGLLFLSSYLFVLVGVARVEEVGSLGKVS